MKSSVLSSMETFEKNRRLLAVVAGTEANAREVAARFAAEGDEAEACWFTSAEDFLAGAGGRHFEAVILFPGANEEATEAAEEALRRTLAGTPVFRVG